MQLLKTTKHQHGGKGISPRCWLKPSAMKSDCMNLSPSLLAVGP